MLRSTELAMAAVVLLLVLTCLHAVAAQGSGKVTKARVSDNLKGDVLILSVNRVPYAENYIQQQPQPVSDLVRSAQDCEDQCSLVSGCQGWTYCSAAGGCGTGCRAYHNATGPRRLGNAYGCTPVGEYLPIKTDSYYTFGLDDYTPDPTVCTEKGGWPQYMCTLKTNIGSTPSFEADGAGWESGTVTLPSKCKGSTKWPMTAYECTICLESSDPSSCLDCSKNLYTAENTCGYARGVYWGRNKSELIRVIRGQTCVACSCYKSSADDRKRCYQATKSIGVSGSPAYTTWSDTLQKAAAQCPRA